MKFGNLVSAALGSDLKVLPLYWSYLEDRDPKAEAEQFTHIVNKNPDRDRVGTWSASSSGSCLRQQQFTFLGMPKRDPGTKGLNIFANGDWVHLRYQVAGLIGGWLLAAEVPVSNGTVRGTMDGWLEWGEVLEIKSINERGYSQVKEFGPKGEHKRQVTAYMLATGLRAARFIYENKNTNEASEFYYEFDPVLGESVQAEWDELDRLAIKRELAPMLEPCTKKQGFDYTYCPYQGICERSSWPKPPSFTSDSSGTSPLPAMFSLGRD